jgi:hypothetical protein
MKSLRCTEVYTKPALFKETAKIQLFLDPPRCAGSLEWTEKNEACSKEQTVDFCYQPQASKDKSALKSEMQNPRGSSDCKPDTEVPDWRMLNSVSLWGNLWIQSFNRYVLSTYYVQCTILESSLCAFYIPPT